MVPAPVEKPSLRGRMESRSPNRRQYPGETCVRWFKHMAQLKRDESVSRYLESNKLAGYGFLMLVFEAVAERMDLSGDRCTATYSRSEWARITRSTLRSVDKYMAGLAEIDWIIVCTRDGTTTVDIPRMVDWRDEYTRKKSGQSPDNSLTTSHRRERDQKTKKQEQSRSFDNVMRKVGTVVEQNLVDPSDIRAISRLSGTSPRQAKAALDQLLDSSGICKKW